MTIRTLAIVAFAAAVRLPAILSAGESDPAQSFLREMAAMVERSTSSGSTVAEGREGWLFLVPELRALSAGPFWGAQAAESSRARDARHFDPLPAIIDFQRQLKARGVKLVFVPVPAKAAVYPEKIAPRIRPGPDGQWPRLDPHHHRFLRMLGEKGVDVVDLLPTFLSRRENDGPLYCRTDSHWTSRASQLAAQLIAQRLRLNPSMTHAQRRQYVGRTVSIRIAGDLGRMQEPERPPQESLDLITVSETVDGAARPPGTWPESPVLLIGDSHTLVFHDPSLHAQGAGLPDHLALELGFPVDLVGIRGSGANAPRIALMRRGTMSGKQIVIWCLSTRELTESSSGWRKVPLPPSG